MGAFGAHVLKDRLTPQYMSVYETGVWYHLIHTVALLGVALLIGILGGSKWLKLAGWFFIAGILLFSGSLYALAITGIAILGAITPFGGLCFLAGWTCLAVGALKAGTSPGG